MEGWVNGSQVVPGGRGLRFLNAFFHFALCRSTETYWESKSTPVYHVVSIVVGLECGVSRQNSTNQCFRKFFRKRYCIRPFRSKPWLYVLIRKSFDRNQMYQNVPVKRDVSHFYLSCGSAPIRQVIRPHKTSNAKNTGSCCVRYIYHINLKCLFKTKSDGGVIILQSVWGGYILVSLGYPCAQNMSFQFLFYGTQLNQHLPWKPHRLCSWCASKEASRKYYPELLKHLAIVSRLSIRGSVTLSIRTSSISRASANIFSYHLSISRSTPICTCLFCAHFFIWRTGQ